ncbi:MAG: NAD-glutamate dehydrogenase [Alphaproteobacteria bacterium]|nr:NAD-glutamate dehydrogenase [Alphaproteobacteria bacterium]
MPKTASTAVKKNSVSPNIARDFFSNIAAEDRNRRSEGERRDIAQLHEELSASRKSGKALVKIITSGSGQRSKTTIDIVNDDMAFLVDSVAAEIARHGLIITLLLHPILQGAKGSESHMHIELDSVLTAPMMAALKADLERVLRDVRLATSDWREIRELLKSCQPALRLAPPSWPENDPEEFTAFLDYLYNDNFTLLGCRSYKFARGKTVAIEGSGKGLLRDDINPAYLNDGGSDGLPVDLLLADSDLAPLIVTKLGKRSTVHRAVPVDAVAVRQFDKNGNITGALLFIGLFTSVTYSRSIDDIPYLRHKAAVVIEQSGFKAGSHDNKALRHILEKYPRDELFQIKLPRLLKTAKSILLLQERQRIALYTRKDIFNRFISCLVYVPRDRYDTRIRMQFQRILEQEFRGSCGSFYASLDDSPLARVMFTINIGPDSLIDYKTAAIEAKLQEAGRQWSEKLTQALQVKIEDDQTISAIVDRFGQAFPIGYQETYLAKQTVHDITKIEDALAGSRFTLDLYKDYTCIPQQVRLKIYHKRLPVTLSEVLPLLENMGLRTFSERPFEIRPKDSADSVWIHDFHLEMKNGHAPTFDKKSIETKAKFEDCFSRIWYGEMENDSLNQLVLTAALDWRDITVMRAYVRYLRQTANPFGKFYLETALTKHPFISRLIIDLFKAYFDPAKQKDSTTKVKSITAAIEDALQHVESLDEDRILRSISGLVQATLRTNFWQRDDQGLPKTWLSFKLDSSQIADLPEPKPFREIFVYSPRVEGVHLRSDWISRGGIRWSDRHEDFRTEVLGLMKTQQVKNSVIVPMGAKGGFVVKQPPKEGGRAAYLQEGTECYKIFIRGLLDITDNNKGGKIVPPRDVVRRDHDDPYLVVAADKGTATFSDTANKLSLEYGHWLGDAFASGGSAGYDHKKMGITARGAWESVKRHFREMGKDIQTEPFTVIGVGDMGGDVFGNGMLLSPHIQLIGAFNHAHIFIDPTPDAASSFKERERLFRDVKGWDGYETQKLSKGGRIFSRTEKSLALTPEIRKLYNIDKDKVSPPELIQAMLKKQVDLLWFGGIGTYIKASNETQADVGDKSNDALRVNAGDIRASVIGEGANLALTQLARVELGLQGVRLNADFIDNSGGVDSSDHEVNIKILMTDIMTNGKHNMDTAKRNKLLASMTEEVANLVLRHNYQQTQGLSLMELQAPDQVAAHIGFMHDLERSADLDRKLDGLPSDEDLLTRQKDGKGLTRPELSLLQAYAKIQFTRDLMATDIPDHEDMQDWLVRYFPVPLQKPYRAEILRHRLHREIIATNLSFQLINRMGPTFVRSTMDKTGASSADVARAWIIVVNAFGLQSLWQDIEALDGKVRGTVQLAALREISRTAERETLWFLTRLGRKPDIKRDSAFGIGIAEYSDRIEDVMTPSRRQLVDARTAELIADGLPKNMARRIATIPMLGAACDVIRISSESKTDIVPTATTYFEVGEYFRISPMRAVARALRSDDRWAAEVIGNVVDRLYDVQTAITIRVLKDLKGKGHKGSLLQRWREIRHNEIGAIEQILADIGKTPVPDISMLIVAEQRLRGLVEN